MKTSSKRRGKTSVASTAATALSSQRMINFTNDWTLSEEIRETIRPHLLQGTEYLVCRKIEASISNYKTHFLLQEHIKDTSGFEFRSKENRKRITNYLNALKLAKEFFNNGQNCIAIMGELETLPFAETYQVLDKAIETLEQSLSLASKKGRPRQSERTALIKNLRSIWEEYTGKSAGTSIAVTKGGGPFVKFARAVAMPILHESDKKGFNEALIAIRKKVGKKQA